MIKKPAFLLLFLLSLSAFAQQQVQLLTNEQLTEYITQQQLTNYISIEGFYTESNINLSKNLSKKAQSYIEFTYSPKSSEPTNYRFFLTISQLSAEDTIVVSSANNRKETIKAGDFFKNKYTTAELPDASISILDYPPYKNHNVVINGIGQSLSDTYKNKSSDFGDSGPCQINVNCSEGSEYQDVKRSTVRILWKNGSTLGWCTGTVVNNTLYDYRPLVLSAEHCAILGTQFSSSADLDQWTFYFNFESPDCSNPASVAGLNTQKITGANLLANSNDNGGESGSDFLLLELQNNIPESFNAFFAGWNRSLVTSPKNGVTIHHPNGDIKKISTNNGGIGIGTFSDVQPNLNSHYVVTFIETNNGYGTTEAGSSGAGLFDENHLLRGTLSGGFSGCNNLTGFDYYGIMGYHWDQNGNTPERRLMDWLDPSQSGTILAVGTNQGDPVPEDTASFSFQNPVLNGDLSITAIGSISDNIFIDLIDISGKIVRRKEVVPIPLADTHLNVANLRNGLYILRISTNGNYKSYRVVIVNK